MRSCHRRYSKGNPAMAKNQRLVLVGGVLIVLAIAFFLFFLSIASKSNNPAELMRVVGTVSGVVGGIGVAMIVFGKVGKKT
jgi:protein-S-isoprenylcysteine O-methyltransferase Ste14